MGGLSAAQKATRAEALNAALAFHALEIEGASMADRRGLATTADLEESVLDLAERFADWIDGA